MVGTTFAVRDYSGSSFSSNRYDFYRILEIVEGYCICEMIGSDSVHIINPRYRARFKVEDVIKFNEEYSK
jgi:hypothetical protein